MRRFRKFLDWKLIVSLAVVFAAVTGTSEKTYSQDCGSSCVEITGTITADNAYALYYGNEEGITLVGYNARWEDSEIYNFSAKSTDYIFVVAADQRYAEGLLAEFSGNGNAVSTGNPAWEAFLTDIGLGTLAPIAASALSHAATGIIGSIGGIFGMQTASSPIDVVPEVNKIILSEIEAADNNNLWAAPTVGGENGVEPWGYFSDMSNTAKWIWQNTAECSDLPFDEDCDNDDLRCFIFRLPVSAISEYWIHTGNYIGGKYINPSTTLPNLSGTFVNQFTIDQIADEIVSDESPYNGFAPPYSSGTITLDLVGEFNLKSFLLWNDINVGREGINEFRLDFFDRSDRLIDINFSSTFAGTLGQVKGKEYVFKEVVSGVSKVDLVVLNSHPYTFNRIEIREVAFTGEPVNPSSTFKSGVFTVGSTGIVKTDFLYDGGMYEGELGIFSLAGMESLEPNSPKFIAEALRRVQSDSEEGHIVLSDKTEGARFKGQLGSSKEPERNFGIYKGQKSFQMKPGDTFATVLVPDSTFAALSGNPSAVPIFSLASSNPDHEMYFGQMAKIEDIGNAFVFEDMAVSGSDRDYNDLIVQITGVTVFAPTLDNPELGFKEDWRKSQNPVIPHIEVSPPDSDTLWMTVTLKSPADLFVYDPQGRMIGKEGGEIPGATFERDAAGHQIVSLPKLDSGEYRIVLRAVGNGGLCHLEIKGYQGNEELVSEEKPFVIGAHQTFTTMISADDFFDSTTVAFSVPDISEDGAGNPLAYDFDGNGKIDDNDIQRLSSLWGKKCGEAEYDPFFDLDNDCSVTVKDIMTVAGSGGNR